MRCKHCGIDFIPKIKNKKRKFCSAKCNMDNHRKHNMEKHIKSCAKYEKTINGFLMRTYRNMKSRVTGIQKLKSHLYQGKELLEKELFYTWSKKNNNFNLLFKEWEDSMYDRKLTPSIDRIDPKIGYILSNMQWITHSENSSKTTKYGKK